LDDPVSQRAQMDFDRARHPAFLDRAWAALRGRSRQLLSFAAVRARLHLGGPIYRGVQPVPLAAIVGSVDRYRDFDQAFLPTQDRTQGRWLSISRAFYEDVDLPPVRLYRIGEAYFVLDGHHRVSVAREQGSVYIDAEVLEIATRVPVGPQLDLDDLEVLGERVDFLERSRLDVLRPEADVRFTVAGAYRRLVEHIAVHGYYLGLEEQREVGADEAVEHWYDHVYLPIVRIVREQGILGEFPGRTDSDLYLWIIDHQHYLRETFGPEAVSSEAAAEDYAQHYSERPITRVKQAARHVVEQLLGSVTGHSAPEPPAQREQPAAAGGEPAGGAGDARAGAAGGSAPDEQAAGGEGTGEHGDGDE
jgi:hypothetical protein